MSGMSHTVRTHWLESCSCQNSPAGLQFGRHVVEDLSDGQPLQFVSGFQQRTERLLQYETAQSRQLQETRGDNGQRGTETPGRRSQRGTGQQKVKSEVIIIQH